MRILGLRGLFFVSVNSGRDLKSHPELSMPAWKGIAWVVRFGSGDVRFDFAQRTALTVIERSRNDRHPCRLCLPRCSFRLPDGHWAESKWPTPVPALLT